MKPEIGRRHDEIALLGEDFDRMAEQIERLVTAQRNLLGDVSPSFVRRSRDNRCAQLLKQGAGEEAGEYQNRIGLEAEQFDQLIGQLLTLTRIDSGVDQTFERHSICEPGPGSGG